MNKFKKAAASTKQFVSDHKTAITVTGTALVCLAIHRFALKGHNEFLKEKGLYEEFYTLNEND
jgi:hypothetical protein